MALHPLFWRTALSKGSDCRMVLIILVVALEEKKTGGQLTSKQTGLLTSGVALASGVRWTVVTGVVRRASSHFGFLVER